MAAKGLAAGSRESVRLLEVLSSSEELKRQYKIEGFLGEGGMGVVFLGIQQELNRKVAIKCIRCDEFGGEEGVKRFMREASVLAGLEHPGIVKIYKVDQAGECLFIVSEFIDGENLKQRLHRMPLRWKAALQLIIDVARVLDYVHEKAIVHRDIKSENVLLPNDGGVKVIDFGLAKDYSGSSASHNVTRQGEFLGTPEYLAPEIIRHQVIGPPCDIYSLGILLFEVMTGQLPYTGKPFDVLTAHLRAPIPSLIDYIPRVPAGLDRLFKRAVAKHPSERHSSAKEFADELATILEAQGRDAFEATVREEQSATRQQDALPSPMPRQRKRRALSSVPTMASSSSVQVQLEDDGAPWKKVLLGLVSLTIVLFLMVFFLSGGEPQIPKDVRLASVGRGALRVRWKSADDVIRVEVRPKAAKKGDEWLPYMPENSGVSIAGLLPGRAYALRMRLSNGEIAAERSFIAPFSSLTLKEVIPPKRMGDEAEMNFTSEEPLLVLVKGVIRGDSKKWRLSNGPSLTHRFAYALDDGFTTLFFEGRRENGSRTQPGLPIKELSKRVINNGRDVPVGKLIRGLVKKFGSKFNKMRLEPEERRKLLIDELLQEKTMGQIWALFPFIPTLMEDDELSLETKQAIYDGLLRLFPIFQIGLVSKVEGVLNIEKLVTPFCIAGNGAEGQGITIDTYEDRDNSLEPRETHIFLGRGMMLKRKAFVGDDPVYPTIVASFPLTRSALVDKGRAILFVTYKEAPAQYCFKVTINKKLTICWADRFSDTEQIGNILGQGKAADWGSKTRTRKWSFPISYFKEGDNSLVFSADAPLGLDSPTTPSLVRAAYSLEK